MLKYSMIRNLLILIAGLIFGLVIGFYYIKFPNSEYSYQTLISPISNLFYKKQVIGFLPYWLLSKENSDLAKYITTLSYFGLRIDSDGSIMKMTNPVETEPGWIALKTGKVDAFFDIARKSKIALSLTVAGGDADSINALISSPKESAGNLLRDVTPIMKQYGFSDLNLDVESTKEASEDARTRFAIFTEAIKEGLNKEKIGTLTVDIQASDFIKNNLINPITIGKIADYILIMGYDYHYSRSTVSGPVAPLGGAGFIYEYDIQAAVEKALSRLPSHKIILGIPLYGYEWETIGETPHSAVIPGTGIIASNLRVEQFLNSCASCSAEFDVDAQESYLIYRDEETSAYHQIYYPDSESTKSKVDYARNNSLGGLALWALGYEGTSIMNPLKDYIN
jgi:spore germination protein